MNAVIRFLGIVGVFSLATAAGASTETRQSHDPHAAHRAAMNRTAYQVSEQTYEIPDLQLLNSAGEDVVLREFLDSDEPIALNFIFTTCTTICPVMTVTFAQMKQLLGEDAERVRLVSISIDPEYDRPAVLDAYAKQFKAGGNWTFLTGNTDDIVAVLKSFDSYAGAKMNHRPITLLKDPESTAWIRIDGLANGKSLAHEVSTRLLN